MNEYRWINQSQPQTLQNAVMIFYIRAVFGLLGGAVASGIGLIFVVAEVASGFGIANEKRWGYLLGVGTAGFAVAFDLWALTIIGLEGTSNILFLISVMFDVALFALLLHPQSRSYQKIWFR